MEFINKTGYTVLIISSTRNGAVIVQFLRRFYFHAALVSDIQHLAHFSSPLARTLYTERPEMAQAVKKDAIQCNRAAS